MNDLLDVTNAYDTVFGLEDWVGLNTVQGTISMECFRIDESGYTGFGLLNTEHSHGGWVQRESLDETLVSEEPKLIERSVKMLVENKILEKNTLRQVLGMPADIIEELCNLPKGYFEQDDTNNVIELRLRSSTQQRSNSQQSSNSGSRVIPLERK